MTAKISYISRGIEDNLAKSMNKGKVIILYGPRQAGKTTLIKNFFSSRNLPYLYLACEEDRIRRQLVPDSLALKKIIGDFGNIVIDEAQQLENPGLVLKVLIDNFPRLNIIASGSSSFDLANKLNEPLTGRHFQFFLYPLSYFEIKKNVPGPDVDFHWREALIFGGYPEIFRLGGREEKIRRLTVLANDYLYKDILSFHLVKNSRKIHDLVTAIGLQLGQEVSYHELSNLLSVDQKTVERYLDLLEKNFVIFRLFAFSRNLRSEINRKVKIYFYDLGIRNALINNFNEQYLRTDAGAMFENYAIAEKIKIYNQKGRWPNFYFWRTYDQKEIDFIEEYEGKIRASEFKLSEKSKLSPATKKQFLTSYPGSEIKLITPENLETFLGF
jgi:predicted AAA+ superfamily ATPase